MKAHSQTGGLLTGNMLKIIAAAAMVADHVGLMFFPHNALLRLVGRLAYPIFAYMIAEGCKYTRNRRNYFLHLFVLAVACQAVYLIVDGSMYLSILFTFSCSILMIFTLQEAKKDLLCSAGPKLRGSGLFVGSVFLVWLLNRYVTVDYGFWGCMVPVFAGLFQDRDHVGPEWLRKLDSKYVHVSMTAVGLVILGIHLGGNQLWSLLALPLLLLYNGKRGKLRMKYFFYIFYPLHLALLQVISWL